MKPIFGRTRYAEKYDEDRYGKSFGGYLRSREIHVFMSMMSPSHKIVLDVGAGTGKLSIPLILGSRRVVSIDSSSEMLKVAREKAKTEGADFESVMCDAENLCFENNAFDCVVASRVLMHLTDWRRGLFEISRVSNDALVVDFPPWLSFSGLGSVLRRIKRCISPDTVTYKAFLISDVIKEMRQYDHEVVAVRKGFFLPMVFHRWLDRPRLSMTIEKLCQMLGLVRLLGAPVILKAIKRDVPNFRTSQLSS